MASTAINTWKLVSNFRQFELTDATFFMIMRFTCRKHPNQSGWQQTEQKEYILLPLQDHRENLHSSSVVIECPTSYQQEL